MINIGMLVRTSGHHVKNADISMVEEGSAEDLAGDFKQGEPPAQEADEPKDED